MKDAYSFDRDQDGMRASYQAMYDAYGRVFHRCGLDPTPVEASSGAFGGSVNHEFMVESPIGEDLFARCDSPGCGYAANIEAAESSSVLPAIRYAEEPMVEHHTPDRPGIDLVVEHFNEHGRALTADRMLKCIAVVDVEDRPAVILVPGNRQVRVPAGCRPFEE